MNEIFLQILVDLILVALPLVVGYLAIQTNKIIKGNKQAQELLNNEAVTKMVVLYVESVYKNVDGKEKFEKAKDKLLEILKSKGVKISDSEIEVLIESVLLSLKKGLK